MRNKITTLLAAAFALSLSTAVIAATCPGPDTFGHECTNDAPGCGQIAGIDNNVTGGALSDDNYTVRPIGFSFNFYGNAYTEVRVASNGYLRMGNGGDGSDFTNDCPVPSAIDPDQSVFGVWDDLNPGGVVGRIQDGVVGSAPNRTYVVEYNNVPFFASGATTSFQIQLNENGGAGESATVFINDSGQNDYTTGIENPGGSDGLSRWCNGASLGTSCTTFGAAPPDPGGGGDCDLTPVLNALSALEAKVDTDVPARFDNLDAGQGQILSELAALSGQVGGLQGNLCEILRLLHTPQGQRTHSSAECGDMSWNFNNGGE